MNNIKFNIPEDHNNEKFEKGMTVREVWEKSPSNLKTKEEFFKFFNQSSSIDDVEKMGHIDFSTRIFTIDFYRLMASDPREKTCLEIGFGGGRLLNAASKYFKKVIGVDIHNEFEKTQACLSSLGCNNFELFHRDNFSNIEDKSIDFVYSFIVFQHFDKWSEVEYYLEQIKRVLKDDGCGILYFGINDKNSDDYIEVGDSKIGDSIYFKTAEEPDMTYATRLDARGYTLIVKPEFAMSKIGENFRIFEAAQGPKRPWESNPSAQFYVKFASKNHPRIMEKK